MGAINDIFSQNKNNFSKIEEILKMLIKQNKNRSQNITVLHEIGLLKEYSYIKSDNCSNELINFSKNSKSIKKLETSSKLREKFNEWAKFLFDINDENLSEEQLNQIIKPLKQKALKKEFFQQNIKNIFSKINLLINYCIMEFQIISENLFGILQYQKDIPIINIIITKKNKRHILKC